jgi:hypothetical protein
MWAKWIIFSLFSYSVWKELFSYSLQKEFIILFRLFHTIMSLSDNCNDYFNTTHIGVCL